MRVMFKEVPVDTYCYEVNHMGDEVWYYKSNPWGIAGMVNNARRLSDGVSCWIPWEKTVFTGQTPPEVLLKRDAERQKKAEEAAELEQSEL